MRRRRGDADQDAILRRARVFILAIAFGGREARAVRSRGQKPRGCARSKSGRGGEEPSCRRQSEAPPTRRRRAHVGAGRVHGPASPQESQSRRAGACPSLTFVCFLRSGEHQLLSVGRLVDFELCGRRQSLYLVNCSSPKKLCSGTRCSIRPVCTFL